MGAAVPQDLIASQVKLHVEDDSSVEQMKELHGSSDGMKQQELDEAVNQNGGVNQNGAAEVDVAPIKAPILGGPSPSEASSEWPEQAMLTAAHIPAPTTKSVSTFYIVKVPRYVESSELKINSAHLKDKKDERNSIGEQIQRIRGKKQEVAQQLVEPRKQLKACRDELKAKYLELNPLLEELKELDKIPWEDQSLCTSESELNAKIVELENSMQHRTMSLREEKEILREIQFLRSSRGSVAVNSMAAATKREALLKRDALRARLKPLQTEIDALKKNRDMLVAKNKPLEDKFEAIGLEIANLVDQKKAVEEVVEDVAAERWSLSNEANLKNSFFYMYKKDIQSAQMLAFKQDKAGVEEFCNAQVEKMMELWNMNPEFRNDYISNNLRSTVRRLGCPDGRSLGPNDKPIIFDEPNSFDARKREPAKEPAKEVVREPAKEPAKEVKTVKAKEPAKEVKTGKTKESAKEPAKELKAEKSEPVTAAPIEQVPEEEAEDSAEREAEEELERQRLEKRRVEEIEKAKEAFLRKQKAAERKEAKEKWRLNQDKRRREMKQAKKAKATAPSQAAASEGSSTESENAADASATINETLQVEATEAVVPRRKKSSTAARTLPFRLPSKKKPSLQRQLFDYWQLILAAMIVILAVLVAAVVFTRA